MTRNIKMILEYDGTRYHGWQRQANGLTVQEVLEEGISTITQEDIRVIGSGRTDAGVHALGQVANFRTNSNIGPRGLLQGINSLLPWDIVVKELAEMLGLRPNRLIADLMQLNVLASINQRVEIELANRIANKYGYTIELERARRSTERKPVLRRDDADDDQHHHQLQ